MNGKNGSSREFTSEIKLEFLGFFSHKGEIFLFFWDTKNFSMIFRKQTLIENIFLLKLRKKKTLFKHHNGLVRFLLFNGVSKA
jgi:hypothetical protein